MTAALEGGEWSAARPGRTSPPGRTRYPFYRRLGGSHGRSGRAENLVPTGIRSRTVQPVAQSLYRLSYPAHYIYIYIYQVSSRKKLILLLVTTFASSVIHLQSLQTSEFLSTLSVIICNNRAPLAEHCCQIPYNCQRSSSSCLLAHSTHYNSYTYLCHLQLAHLSVFFSLFLFDSSVPKQQVSPSLSATHFHESTHFKLYEQRRNDIHPLRLNNNRI